MKEFQNWKKKYRYETKEIKYKSCIPDFELKCQYELMVRLL